MLGGGQGKEENTALPQEAQDFSETASLGVSRARASAILIMFQEEPGLRGFGRLFVFDRFWRPTGSVCLFVLELEIKPRALLYMADKCSTIELTSQPKFGALDVNKSLPDESSLLRANESPPWANSQNIP